MSTNRLYLIGLWLLMGCGGVAEKSSPLTAKQITDFKEEARSVLPDGAAKDLVVANCVHCHGHLVFTQNAATREGWKDMIEWMQRTQGLWPLGPAEEQILDYLAQHFAPGQQGRRVPLTDIEWYTLE